MNRSADRAREVVKQFSDLAQHLAEQNIVLRSLHIDRGFGSWMIEVEEGAASDAYQSALQTAGGSDEWPPSGPDVVRVTWDGRDRILTAEIAPTESLTSPGPWKQKMEKTFERPDDAFQFAAEHVAEWLRAWSH